VFQIALERDELDGWTEDLRTLAVALEDREFVGLLDAPQVPLSRKTAMVRGAMGDSIGRLATNLISLLASRNLAHMLPSVFEEFTVMLDQHRGVERADIVSAVALDDAQKEKISRLLEGLVGKRVSITSLVDPQILGGLVATVGDRVIDGSARTKLRDMRRELVERR
jgi:F-type H+-transporting ATPase subunit delta